MSNKIVQTAGRDQLGEFAPMFAHLNDDVLFGEVWNENAIDVKTKCIITVVSLMASGITVCHSVILESGITVFGCTLRICLTGFP